MPLNRRSFIKSTVEGVAGVTLAGGAINSTLAKPMANDFTWTDKMKINPDIDNMRVICMHDPKMAADPTGSSFSAQNKVVNDQRVRDNLDKMAMHLTGKATQNEAWKTIFRSSKAWKDTKVMVKVNTVEAKMLARVSVIKKIVDVLIDFGVQPENIVMFDGQGMSWKTYESVVSLTDNTKIRAKLSNSYSALGGQTDIKIPDISAGFAPGDLVKGTTDIIVNIAVNKGHNSPSFKVGMTTLCLKNHFGTFLSSGGSGGIYGGSLMATHLHSTKGLININKIPEIVGGNPVRQQLCIIDSLWAMKDGPSGSVDAKPDRLIMGTFAGAVDYCCVKEVREKLMNVTNHQKDVIPQFLTAFGYKETDPEWVEITPDTVAIRKVNPNHSSESITFTLNGSSMPKSTLHFNLPRGNRDNLTVRIVDMKGRVVREINERSGVQTLQWDGRAANGNMVAPGSYMVSLSAGSFRETMQMTVVR
ncbi:MAG TPA: FlgD immunoglobulin-like domain containing protein [Chitinispirillaceae bacterium]|nr:FlgD immunoglobulin-like domain containing protein [Chitinispirillaceae bacterium]